MPDAPPPKVRVSRFSVSCVPDGHPLAVHFTLLVSERRRDRWAVTRLVSKCLSADGTWDHDLAPSLQPAGWDVLHHFDQATALRLAKEAAATLVVDGRTVADVLAQAVRAR